MTQAIFQEQEPHSSQIQLADTPIGIWGYGIGGKAIADFVAARGAHVMVFDARTFSEQERIHLDTCHAHVCTSLEEFFQKSAFIIPSAGVDLRAHAARKKQFISELDLFGSFFHKPIIAVTGSIGKTTVTTLIGELLKHAGKHVLVGGNIGIPMCSLIEQQAPIDYAVIEVSSFQLESCQSFAPHVGVWTNFYPNHLDRHTCIDEYFAAKSTLFAHQQITDWALLPADVYKNLQKIRPFTQNCLIFPENTPPAWHDFIHRQQGFAVNWICALSVLQAFNLEIPEVTTQFSCTIEHRLELVDTINNVSFYNDSKATIAQATLAAVTRLQPHPIILLLGGLSKGVDRQPLVQALRTQVDRVICFGAEAEKLANWCAQENIPYTMCVHFDEIVVLAYTYAIQKSDSVVVLSPGGSSFDLFKNYQERGMRFKHLVQKLKESV